MFSQILGANHLNLILQGDSSEAQTWRFWQSQKDLVTRLQVKVPYPLDEINIVVQFSAKRSLKPEHGTTINSQQATNQEMNLNIQVYVAWPITPMFIRDMDEVSKLLSFESLGRKLCKYHSYSLLPVVLSLPRSSQPSVTRNQQKNHGPSPSEPYFSHLFFNSLIL